MEIMHNVEKDIEAALESWSQLRYERPQDAIPSLEVALARARQLQDAVLVGRLLVALGQGAALRGDGAVALRYADEALELLEPYLPSSGDFMVGAFRIVGRVQYDLGNDELALEAFSKALSLCQSDSERIAVQGNIASIQTELGQLEAAIATYDQLISAAEALDDKNEVSHLRSNLALALERLARQQQESDGVLSGLTRVRAMQQAKLALEEAIIVNDKTTQSHVLRTIAQMLLEDGLLDQAWDALERSLQLAIELESVWNEIHCLIGLAKIARDLHDYPRGLELAFAALKKAQVLHFQEHASQAHARLASIYEAQGNFQAALKHERKHFELDNLVKSEAASKRAEALAAGLQLERARLEAKVERERAENLHQENRSLEQQAMTDALTGVANRRALGQHLERTHALAVRSGQLFSVVIFDLDFFKRINDTFSHVIGDAVLKRIGALLREQCRKGDFAARYGGEEFSMVLMGADFDVAFEVCERFRISIETQDWQSLAPDLQVTASFGFCADCQLESADKMLEVADLHLYTAKSIGRNTVFPNLPILTSV